MVAYHPEEKILVIAESKVRGPKDCVYAYTKDTREGCGTFVEFDNDSYLSFVSRLPTMLADGVLFADPKRMVDKIIVHLVSNYYVDHTERERASKEVRDVIRENMLHGWKFRPIDVELESTIKVLASMIEIEAKSTQGRRYGHPALDIAREINRYMNPKVRYAGRAKEQTEAVRVALRNRFLEALGLGSVDPE